MTKHDKQWYCEDCQDTVSETELSSRYHDAIGRWVCCGCILDIIERCVIHLVPREDYTEIWVEFNEVIFTDFCNTTDILTEAIQSHGYVVKKSGDDWVGVDKGDAIIMKIGNVNNGLNSILEFITTSIWETYV